MERNVASRIELNASHHRRGYVIRRIPQASHSPTPTRRMHGPYPGPSGAVKSKPQCKYTSSVERRSLTRVRIDLPHDRPHASGLGSLLPLGCNALRSRSRDARGRSRLHRLDVSALLRAHLARRAWEFCRGFCHLEQVDECSQPTAAVGLSIRDGLVNRPVVQLGKPSTASP